MKSKWLYTLSLSLVLLTGLAACSQPASSGVVGSDKPRASGTAAQSDVAALVEGNNAFAFDLYGALKGAPGNLFYSPYSISQALAMTYAGARDTTQKEMAGTLHFTLAQDRLHPAFNSLDQQLKARGQGARGKDGKGFRLNIVNAIWGQVGYTFLADYLDLLAQNYGAGLRTLDFRAAPELSRQTINKWVEDQTEQRIKDLIPGGGIDPLTRLVLTNAIYFNAAWANNFEKNATRPAPFHLIDGSTLDVPMMRQTERLGYSAGDGYQAVSLPYDGRELEMVVLLPDGGKFAEFEKSLDAGKAGSIIKEIEPKQVALSLPGFKFESEFDLGNTLAGMGMPTAFSGRQADFSGMTGNRELSISRVIHKAFVGVDESGTEAAAATAVIMRATAMPAMPQEVTVDRPFIFLIRDIQTGSVIFVGRVVDPLK
ncbi:MAG: serpin family protein [Chloroflexi bacterium]|nr:serpin family protein [Chloroflexota bacterium]